jgi:hypothetical protein
VNVWWWATGNERKKFESTCISQSFRLENTILAEPRPNSVPWPDTEHVTEFDIGNTESLFDPNVTEFDKGNTESLFDPNVTEFDKGNTESLFDPMSCYSFSKA